MTVKMTDTKSLVLLRPFISWQLKLEIRLGVISASLP